MNTEAAFKLITTDGAAAALAGRASGREKAATAEFGSDLKATEEETESPGADERTGAAG